ncbi:hypothetical protein COMA2_80004 [Candidatus Nitrospira nitrificans]|uniref:Uncharacterized protein n=1 Tax=Candidatus Nitrospira nitrificans TaxID=1742973 RepID=A0A0S4LS17_9BACT|nr:hypothetical protein COMA2_80004 [Candidatus Nitrospira nitrificans]
MLVHTAPLVTDEMVQMGLTMAEDALAVKERLTFLNFVDA